MRQVHKGLSYVKVDSYSSVPTLRVPEAAFLELLKRFNNSLVYLREWKAESGAKVSEFMFCHNGIMYVSDGYGYETLSDMKKAGSKGFNGCSTKYSVSRGSVMSLEDVYRDERSSDGEVYYYSKSHGYKNFKELADAASRGFGSASAGDYRFAIGKGLSSFREYIRYQEFRGSMTKAGFENEDEYKRALELGLTKRDAYNDYLMLERFKVDNKFKTFQEAHLFLILNRKELGREKYLAKIINTLQREQPENWATADYHGENKKSEWYTERFTTPTEVEAFLRSDPAVRKLGIYHPDKKTFTSFSDKTILVDGSNVAYNGADEARGSKPYARNIKLVVEEVRKRGFSDIKVFYDANLPYVVEDKAVFDDLQDTGVLRAIPVNTQASDFLLKFAKEYGAYIVTNDSFRDWAEKDPWVAANLRDFRIPFFIEDGVVKFATNYDSIDGSTFGSIDVSGFGGFRSIQRTGAGPRRTIFERSVDAWASDATY